MGVKYTIEKVREVCASYNLVFLDEIYIGGRYKHNIKCYCGNIFKCRIDGVFSGGVKSCGCLKRKPSFRRRNLVGKRFGKLTVLEFAEIRNGQSYWKCKCDCGKEKIIHGGNIFNGNTVSCGCYIREITSLRGYKGTKDISGQYFSIVKRGAKDRNLEFNITKKYIQELLEKQNYRCALSGRKIYGSRCTQRGCPSYQEMTASLDRIDSKKGYTEDNIQWVHKQINIAKQNLSDEEFIKLCCDVADFSRGAQ